MGAMGHARDGKVAKVAGTGCRWEGGLERRQAKLAGPLDLLQHQGATYFKQIRLYNLVYRLFCKWPWLQLEDGS